MTKKELLARIEALEMRLAILESEKWSAVPAFPAAPPIPWWNQWYCSDTTKPLPWRGDTICEAA